MKINELYDSIVPLHNRFLDFCRKQGFENVYDLTFFNYFDLELNGFSLIEIINLQSAFFDKLASLDIDLSAINTRLLLKSTLENKESYSSKCYPEKPIEAELNSNNIVTTVLETPTPQIEKLIKSVVVENKVDKDVMVSDFSNLTELGKSYDDIYLSVISNHVPGYNRLKYKSFKLFTIGDYKYVSHRQLTQLFENVTQKQFEDYLDLLYFINNIRLKVNEENESVSLLPIVSTNIFEICYRNKVERYKDLKVIAKVVKIFENIPKEFHDDLIMELEY